MEEEAFTDRFVEVDDIPFQKKKRLIDQFPIRKNEEIVSFLDDTLSNNGKRGVLFTNKGIHWKGIESKGFIRYSELTNFSSTLTNKDHINLQINENKLEIIVAKYDSDEFQANIEELQSKYWESSNCIDDERTKVSDPDRVKIGFSKRLFIIELPYLFLIGLFLYDYMYVLPFELLRNLVIIGAVIFVLTVPFRLKVSIAKIRLKKSWPNSIFLLLPWLIIDKVIISLISSLFASIFENAKDDAPPKEFGSRKDDNWYCKSCGIKYRDIRVLQVSKCSKSKHNETCTPYQGIVGPPYYCTHCGRSYKTLHALVNAHCLGKGNSTDRCIPYEGKQFSPFICKHCGSKHNSLKYLAVNDCLKSPIRHCQPL